MPLSTENEVISKKLLTIVYVVKDGKVLLGLKKRGFGAGNWNGFGGKVETGETIEQAARRELEEECALTVDRLEKIGVVDQEFVNDPVVLEIHIFKADNYHGNPAESEEMKPKWFSAEDIPFDKMWADDKYWMPYLLKNVRFYGYYLFEGFHTIIKQKLVKIDDVGESVKSLLHMYRGKV
ncbi:oxidized purine nucleoside triphosphate hydrolase-like [Saccoglossus kowalevskii]|uniref:Oxidized purine nucleoside triphosphate hydrolase n=1 Tax=Saccoglossus kowalevskii TaxID=10224 RepID=A0ABM0GML9_SACKO|nr:PREDICTED: 7,8-dihydro-8-oxoguanine triphosphatase-like [Saccoglossus kowalevskii]